MEMTRNDDVIRWLKWHARINLGVVMIFVVWVVIVFFASLHRGFGRAIVETLFGALLCLFMAWAILWLVDRTFGKASQDVSVSRSCRRSSTALSIRTSSAPGIVSPVCSE